MVAIREFLAEAWAYKVSLLPIIMTYLLFDAQAIYRRATKTWYVPIYFIVFPSGHSDKLYAEYFGEDDFFGSGSCMTISERESLRNRIVSSAILSMIFATVVAPYLCGSISAFYLSRQQFTEFLVTLMLIKASFIIYALYNVRVDSRVVNKGTPFYCIVIIYIAYLYFVFRGLSKSFEWASTNFGNAGAWGLVTSLGDLIHEEFFINFLVITLLTWAVQQQITKPENILPLPNDIDSQDS